MRSECSNACHHPLKSAKLNIHIKYIKKLFDLNNTFLSNFYMIILLQNFLGTLKSLTSTM